MDVNCSSLEQFDSFESYVDRLRDVAGFNLTLEGMQPCKQEVCTTLYGTGSSDVSGIGVIVGYFVEFSLALVLAITLLVLRSRNRERLMDSCRKVTAAYADSAIALALSVELACAIMLLKKNFGLGAYEFGGLTVQIVWIVATLVMLPVISFCWQDLKDGKSELRICMTAIAFLLFLITFICRMISTYSGKQIGSDEESVISHETANLIRDMCFGAGKNFSPSGSMVIEVFSIGGSLWVSCNIILALVDHCLNPSRGCRVAIRMQSWTSYLRDEMVGSIVSIVALMVWSIPLFWALMALRSWQKTFAESFHEQSGSDVWSFGQIIAVIVFLPVLNELLHQYLDRSKPYGLVDQQLGIVQLADQVPKSNSV